MTGFALLLILLAACCHATWNLLAKRAGGGAAFVWLASTAGAAVFAPAGLALIAIKRPHLGGTELLFITASAVLHVGYFVLLQRGYRAGDLSLVYPIARGTGPMLATITAIVLFAERPTPVALAGAILIAISVFVVTGGRNALRASSQPAVLYGLLTGTLIASYTLWDKHAVSTLLIPPLVYDWGLSLGRTVLLAPVALRHRQEVRLHLQQHRLEVLGVGVLGSLAYILVLTAMVFTPVSYVAPAREVSILIAALMGTRLLAEGETARRLTAASSMVLGVIALAVG